MSLQRRACLLLHDFTHCRDNALYNSGICSHMDELSKVSHMDELSKVSLLRDRTVLVLSNP